jgi:hypothetical protein
LIDKPKLTVEKKRLGIRCLKTHKEIYKEICVDEYLLGKTWLSDFVKKK